MKGIYLIAVAFLAQAVIAANETTFEAEDECPTKDPYPPKLIFHEVDCTRYYECRNGDKILKICKAGLHFSKNWYGCVKPAKSECGGEPPIYDDSELLKHECQCTKFYEFKNNQKVLHECKPGEFFDEERKSCIPGNYCKPLPKPECEHGELLPHECQCTKYYLCVNGRKVLRKCTKGWHFNKVLLDCIEGRCPQDPPPQCCYGAKKEHECFCEKYYRCGNKGWIVEDCQEGLHFSPTLLKCTTPDKAGCDKSPPPPDFPGKCPNNVPTKWPHECDCRLYYECEDKKKKVQACAWGKYFDYLNQVCDDAARLCSKCKNSWDDWV